MIEDEEFLKTLDITASKNNLQILNYIGNEIIIDPEKVPT